MAFDFLFFGCSAEAATAGAGVEAGLDAVGARLGAVALAAAAKARTDDWRNNNMSFGECGCVGRAGGDLFSFCFVGPHCNMDLHARLRELEEDEQNLKEHTKSLEALAADAVDPNTITGLQLKYVEKQIDTFIRLIAVNLTEQRKIRHQLRIGDSIEESPTRRSKIAASAAPPPPPEPPMQPPQGYAFADTIPQVILPSRLLKRRVYFWYTNTWHVGEVVGGPKDPKESSQGYTLQIRSSKMLDPTSPEHIRREPESMKMNVQNYGQSWFLLTELSSS